MHPDEPCCCWTCSPHGDGVVAVAAAPSDEIAGAYAFAAAAVVVDGGSSSAALVGCGSFSRIDSAALRLSSSARCTSTCPGSGESASIRVVNHCIC